jgi:hypothetical protein
MASSTGSNNKKELTNTILISKSAEQVNFETIKKNINKEIAQIQTQIKNVLSK